jgi:hypothetical protein
VSTFGKGADVVENGSCGKGCACVEQCVGEIAESFLTEWTALQQGWLGEQVRELVVEAERRCREAALAKLKTQLTKEACDVEEVR